MVAKWNECRGRCRTTLGSDFPICCTFGWRLLLYDHPPTTLFVEGYDWWCCVGCSKLLYDLLYDIGTCRTAQRTLFPRLPCGHCDIGYPAWTLYLWRKAQVCLLYIFIIKIVANRRVYYEYPHNNHNLIIMC